MNLRIKKNALLVLVIYLAGVLFFTLIVRESLILRTPDSRGIILTPFREFTYMLRYRDHMFWFGQIVLNILLFMPLGGLLPHVHPCFQKSLRTVLAGLIFSCSIEAMQYLTKLGLSEIDDVINNTLGTLIGYLMLRNLLRQLFRKWDEWELQKK